MESKRRPAPKRPPRSTGRARENGTELSAAEPSQGLPELPLMEIDVDAGPSTHWIREVIDRWHLRVRIDVCRSTGADGSSLLQVVELMGNPGDLGAAERFLRHRDDIQSLTVMSPSPSRRFVRAVMALPDACRRVFEVGAICGNCKFAPTSRPNSPAARWTLVVPRTPDSLRAVARAQSGPSSPPAPILRMRRFVPPRTLTPRQTAALETAYRLGFYAFPRRSNLREISRILGVSRSTTAELLRRAEGKMLAQQIGET